MTTDEERVAGRVASLRSVEHEVGVLLRRVRRTLAIRAHAVHPDLQPSAYVVLAEIVRSGPLRGSDLCTVLSLDKGAASRAVQHLIDLGLVERKPDPDDGRATLLSASAQGDSRVSLVDTERRKALDERFSDWDDAALDDLAEVLQRYNASFT